VLAIPAF